MREDNSLSKLLTVVLLIEQRLRRVHYRINKIVKGLFAGIVFLSTTAFFIYSFGEPVIAETVISIVFYILPFILLLLSFYLTWIAVLILNTMLTFFGFTLSRVK